MRNSQVKNYTSTLLLKTGSRPNSVRTFFAIHHFLCPQHLRKYNDEPISVQQWSTLWGASNNSETRLPWTSSWVKFSWNNFIGKNTQKGVSSNSFILQFLEFRGWRSFSTSQDRVSDRPDAPADGQIWKEEPSKCRNHHVHDNIERLREWINSDDITYARRRIQEKDIPQDWCCAIQRRLLGSNRCRSSTKSWSTQWRSECSMRSIEVQLTNNTGKEAKEKIEETLWEGADNYETKGRQQKKEKSKEVRIPLDIEGISLPLARGLQYKLRKKTGECLPRGQHGFSSSLKKTSS